MHGMEARCTAPLASMLFVGLKPSPTRALSCEHGVGWGQ